MRADASNRAGTRPRPTSTAPSERRCGVVHCTSNSARAVEPQQLDRRPARDLRRVGDAVEHRLAREEPRRCARRTARRRARRRCHISTECAQPSSCRRVYASTNDCVDPAVRAGAGRRTRASRRRTRCRRAPRSAAIARRSDRLQWNPSSGMMPRGSGDHHASDRPAHIGNSPRRYAASSVPGCEVGADRDDLVGPVRRVGIGKVPDARRRLDRHCVQPRYASSARAI